MQTSKFGTSRQLGRKPEIVTTTLDNVAAKKFVPDLRDANRWLNQWVIK